MPKITPENIRHCFTDPTTLHQKEILNTWCYGLHSVSESCWSQDPTLYADRQDLTDHAETFTTDLISKQDYPTGYEQVYANRVLMADCLRENWIGHIKEELAIFIWK